MGLGKNTWQRTPLAQTATATVGKWDCLRLKQTSAKETASKVKRQHTEQEENFVNSTFDRGLILNKNSRELNSRKTNHSANKWANKPNRQFSKEAQMAN